MGAWNKGLSADPNSPNYDPRVAKYVNTHIGKPSGSLGKTWTWSNESRINQSKRTMGQPSWNKGLNKETDTRLVKQASTLSSTIRSSPTLLKVRSKNGKNNKGKPNWISNLTKEIDPRVAKISISLKGKPKTPEHRKALSINKMSLSPEKRRRAASIAGTVSMAKLTPEERSKKALNAFLRVPKVDTSIELILQKQLNKHNILFTTQKPLLGITAVDIFILPNICIYADGDYWHTLPGVLKKDSTINKTLIENGYSVLRFWGSEIRNNPEICISKILDIIKN